MLKFSFTKVKGRGTFFLLIGPGEEVFLTSIVYDTLVSCQNGAREVIESCGDIRTFDLISKRGRRYDPESGLYSFVIRDSRGRELAQSDDFDSEEERRAKIRFLRMNVGKTRFDEKSWNRPTVF